MSEWQTFCLKDLGKIVGGATPSTNNPKNYGNKIAWITPKDLSTLQGRYIKKGSRSISRLGFKSCSTFLLPKHAILFSVRAPIGYVAIAKKRLCTNQGFKSIIPNKKIYFEFLYYLLKYHKDNISNIGGGTTFKEVSGATLGLFKVKIPLTYYEQQKIARTLSILDQKIENNHKINELLHKILGLLYEQYFVRFDFLDENNKPYQTSGGKMKFSKELNRLIPSGWSVRFLNHKIVLTYQPKTISKTLLNDSYSYSVYGGGGIIGRFTEYNHEQSEFIISCRGQCGIPYLTLPKSWITGNAMVIRPTKSYTSKTYLYHTIKKYKLTNYITGSVQPQITRQNLSTMPILIPKRKTLNKWNNISSLLWNLIHNNMQSTQTLTALRDFLLPLLLKQQVKPE
ncbi:type I restriction enzyme specificity subunit [Helicobacter pylori CPY6271]|uniref:restriction endonuclease subunit S n=1 Tax=Helicobacter pylori TaxID=210 RepID=UPI00026A7404|nr:restriction endonuclease subunit S [Helicobacter pylori]EJB25934.1 type I restriction enzyme specificity subunit [Helicobacter pylori CPY6271]